EAELGEQQTTRVEILRADRAGEGLAFGIPGAFEKRPFDRMRGVRPVARAIVQAEVGGDCREPVAACPAHRGRMRMHALTPAIFPKCLNPPATRFRRRATRAAPTAGKAPRRPAAADGDRKIAAWLRE